MGYRAHVQTKHVIEYGGCHFNWQSEEIHDWLVDNGMDICRYVNDAKFRLATKPKTTNKKGA